MRFGLYLIGKPSGAARSSAPLCDPVFLVPFVQHAESLGIESVFLVDHILFPADQQATYPYAASGRYPYDNDEMQLPEPLMLFAYLGAVTTTMRFGTAVLVLPQRSPMLLAKQLSTVDRLTDGRVELGIGAGWLRDEFDALGSDFATRGARTDEYIDVLRTLWRNPVASFDGPTVQFRDMKLTIAPSQPGGPPIIVGGQSRAAIRRAALRGDAFLPALNIGLDADGFRAAWAAVQAETQRIERAAPTVELQGFGDTLADAHALAELGATRMIHNVLEPDLPSALRHLDTFAQEVMGQFP